MIQLDDFIENQYISEAIDIIDTINSCYNADDQFNISPYTTLNQLLNTLQPLSDKYISSILLLYNNLVNDLEDEIKLFFESQEFMLFIDDILKKNSSANIFEYVSLILLNTAFNDQKICLHYLENGILDLISEIENDDFEFNKNISELLSTFLKYDLNDYKLFHESLLKKNWQNLQSKNDIFKCYGVKGFINALKWSDLLYDFLEQNIVFNYLCDLLMKSYSLKLIRLVQTFMLELIQKDENYLIQLINSDLELSIRFVVEQNEQRCSSLCLELYKHIISYNSFQNDIDLTFLLSFQDKGYIAKKKLVEFISWLFENGIDAFLGFDECQIKDILYIIDDIAQSNDFEADYSIADLYRYIEDSEYGQFLLSLLSENEEFKFFLLETVNMTENCVYIDNKINELINSGQ